MYVIYNIYYMMYIYIYDFSFIWCLNLSNCDFDKLNFYKILNEFLFFGRLYIC